MKDEDLANISLYITNSHSCSYLPEKQAKTLFVDPNKRLNGQQYSELASSGFRRSGHYIYQPHCENCQACISVRVVVDKFVATRHYKRILRYNQDIQVKKVAPQFTEEYFSLYERYIATRHADGDMYPATKEQYKNFLVDVPDYCTFYEFRAAGRLLAVAVIDCLEDSLSAVYTFFEPSEQRRSLGNYVILWQIQKCKALRLPYLALGYWIKDCRKMSYKLAFRPLELYVNQRWIKIS